MGMRGREDRAMLAQANAHLAGFAYIVALLPRAPRRDAEVGDVVNDCVTAERGEQHGRLVWGMQSSAPVRPFMNVRVGSSHSTVGVYPSPCAVAAARSTWMRHPWPLLSMMAYLPCHRDRPWDLSPTWQEMDVSVSD